jgi:uncharacterized protein (TIRG00374 family)
LLIISWPDIQEGFREIGGAKWSILALIIPIKLFGFYAIAMLYFSYLKSYGYKKISKWAMYKVSLELNFVNSVFPSGGVAGFTYLGYRMRYYNVPTARTTLAQTLRFILTFISFLILLFIGLFMLSFGASSSGVTLFIGLSIAFLTLFGTLALVFIISDEKRIKSFAAFLPKLINSIFKVFNKRKPAINVQKIQKLFGEMHDDYLILMKDRKKLRKPFVWALLINISEILAMYIVYLALSSYINPGAVILAYSVASFAGLISILPGGIGVYEALMTTTLAASGVPKALALSATLIYRIITMVAFIPVGFIFYQLALKKGEAEEVHSDGTISTNSD